MRPVLLKMSAFGSYGGLEELDFSNVNNGLFLIAGDTGSGKSTIFDAIMFALYGTLSGKERKSTMMRSEYASDKTETFVEFTFAYRNGSDEDIYTIRRNPAYMRRSLRKNKSGNYDNVKQDSKVSLIMPDGTEFPGKITDVNNKIEEIIGLNAEQFSKIALIAQGEFQELIMDKTGKRKEIFQHIFSTQIYDKIEKKITEKCKEMYGQRKNSNTKLEQQIDAAIVPKESPYIDEWNSVVEKMDTESEEIINVLGREIERVSECDKEKSRLQNQINLKLKELSDKITKGKEKNVLIAKLDMLQEKKSTLEGQKAEIDKKAKVVKSALAARNVRFNEIAYTAKLKEHDDVTDKKTKLTEDKQRLSGQKEITELNFDKLSREYEQRKPELIKEQNILQQHIENYKEISEKEKTQKLFDNREKNISAELEKLNEKLAGNNERKKEIEEFLEKNKDVGLSKNKSENELETVTAKLGIISKIFDKKREIDELQNDFETASLVLGKSLKEWEMARREHEEIYRKYISCQSSILAAGLKEGQACPVCGSVNHPCIAKQTSDTVSDKDLKKAEQKENKFREKQQNDRINAENINASLKSAKQMVIEYIIQIADCTENAETISSESQIWKEINDKKISLSDQKQILLSDIQKAKELMEECENVKKQFSEILLDNEIISKDIENNTQDLNRTLIEKEGVLREILLLRNSMKDKDEKTVCFEFEVCKKELLELEQNYKDADNDFKQIQEKLTSVQGALGEIIKLAEKLDCEVTTLKEKYIKSISDNGFNSEENYHLSQLSEKDIDDISEEINCYKDSVISTNAEIKTIDEQLSDREMIDISRLESEYQEYSEQYKIITDELSHYNYCVKTNQTISERLQLLLAERGDFDKKLKVIKSLDAVANGKVHFQTYIQRQYFKQIIQAANKRLVKMTSGAFILKCRDMTNSGQGENGLELDVYIPASGKTRDAHTLSGGETFMAALSMALGMADIVHNTVGKTKIDTMFIDEGFGSLSDESRDKAVNVLLELAGDQRLVGVISHVSELKEQIPYKLIVNKGNRGSTLKWNID